MTYQKENSEQRTLRNREIVHVYKEVREGNILSSSHHAYRDQNKAQDGWSRVVTTKDGPRAPKPTAGDTTTRNQGPGAECDEIEQIDSGVPASDVLSDQLNRDRHRRIESMVRFDVNTHGYSKP